MSFRTMWRLGHEWEARLIWYGEFPEDRPSAILQNMTPGMELLLLRSVLVDKKIPREEIFRSVKVERTAFPKTDDIEFDEWYDSLNSDNVKPKVQWVLPDFLDELRNIADDKVGDIAEAWCNVYPDESFAQDKGYSAALLKEMIGLARQAGKRGMGILSYF
jgi:hypothetical protein